MIQKITPFLWFDGKAVEAARYYTSIFKNSKMITDVPEGGDAMVVSFELEGMEFMALNGGPMYKFTHAVSFMVHCDSQEEVDYFWDKLLADGGEPDMCGWLRDKFGLSWQITPKAFFKLMQSEEPGKSERVMQAMMQMQKFDIKALEEA